jgi:hypothetical protein
MALGTDVSAMKLFFFVNDMPDKKARVFVLGMTFQPNLLFGGKATAYQSGEVHPSG